MYKPTMTVYVEGQGEIEVYTIGYVAKLLKKSVETLRAWERQKVVPRPLYKKKNGVRLYHPKEVLAMKKVLRKLGKNASKEDIRREMYATLRVVRKEILYGPEKTEEKQNPTKQE